MNRIPTLPWDAIKADIVGGAGWHVATCKTPEIATFVVNTMNMLARAHLVDANSRDWFIDLFSMHVHDMMTQQRSRIGELVGALNGQIKETCAAEKAVRNMLKTLETIDEGLALLDQDKFAAMRAMIQTAIRKAEESIS